ncbi:MAG: DNA-binding protein [Candidatus Aenigmatarchaeota archaeon]
MKSDDVKQFEDLKNQTLRKVLSKNALERLGRVKLANPVLATQLEMYLLQAFQTGQLKGNVDDKKLKQILNILVPKKRKTSIKRK